MRFTREREAVGLLLYLAILSAGLFVVAIERPLWYDELFTLYLAEDYEHLPLNLAKGADLNPPLSYLVSAAFLKPIGFDFSIRFPSIVAAWIASLSVYFYVRRRFDRATAWLAMPLIMVSPGIAFYFQEARPYAWTLAWTALAVWAYVRATEAEIDHRLWSYLFTISLMLGILSHYHFITVAGVFAIAECMRNRQRNRIDWFMALCISTPVIVLLATYQLWLLPSIDYSKGFWSRSTFSWEQIHTAYSQLYTSSSIFILLLLIIVAVIVRQLRTDNIEESTPTRLPIHELVLLVVLAMLPIVSIFITALLDSAFHHRYVMPCVVGIAILLAVGLKQLVGNSQLGVGLLIGIVIFQAEFGFWVSELAKARATREQINDTAMVLYKRCRSHEVVVSSPIVYLDQFHNAEKLQTRLVYVADPVRAVAHHYADTGDRGLLALKQVNPKLDIWDLRQLIIRIDVSVVYYAYAVDGSPGWVMDELIKQGYHFEFATENQQLKVFRIVRKDQK